MPAVVRHEVIASAEWVGERYTPLANSRPPEGAPDPRDSVTPHVRGSRGGEARDSQRHRDASAVLYPFDWEESVFARYSFQLDDSWTPERECSEAGGQFGDK